MLLCGWKHIIVSQLFANVSGHRSFCNRYKIDLLERDKLKVLVCHVLLKWWHHQHLFNYSRLCQLYQMFLLARFGSHKFHENGDISSYISSYVDDLAKDEFPALLYHIEIFLKSIIAIDNCKVADTAGRKTRRVRRRRTKSQWWFRYCVLILKIV